MLDGIDSEQEIFLIDWISKQEVFFCQNITISKINYC
jgi:hypothetical protein